MPAELLDESGVGLYALVGIATEKHCEVRAGELVVDIYACLFGVSLVEGVQSVSVTVLTSLRTCTFLLVLDVAFTAAGEQNDEIDPLHLVCVKTDILLGLDEFVELFNLIELVGHDHLAAILDHTVGGK